ncbi:2-hydroxyacid dehydrogenase [Clostridium paridis]|uniref:D-glycerate dehydrogenase n=1 Tax=Clostridium paridis TaxID=2803863 RepID=A0A937FBY0_9CLOT|nr:D-glycerate dehydrogenase [Clostridium paridis]MBL4931250.1 D-glycerate dehydrogenase [Clostridium paridis]
MDKPKVFIARKILDENKEYLEKYCDLETWDSDLEITREELLDRLSDKEGLLTVGTKIDEELLNRAPKLKIVSNISVGYNNFDLEAMKKRGVIGTHTPNVLDDTVADLIFGLIISSARRIPELDRYVKNGEWKPQEDDDLFGVNVHHRTLGIIGMGRIGEAVAKRGKLGFDMDVIYYNRNRKLETENNLGVRYCEFDELLKTSDFIVLMTPLTKETRELIGYREFDLMKKSSIFINASRGQTINEKALIEALENKKILGAGLDVFKIEPVEKDNPLLKMNNVITLPHIGSAVEETRRDMFEVAVRNLVKGVQGKIPPNVVPELK